MGRDPMTKRRKGGHPLSSSAHPSCEASYKRGVGSPQTYRGPPPQNKAGVRGQQGNIGQEWDMEKAHRPH